MHNVNSMFYFGEKPWHKLGKELANAATSAEAMAAAGLDWTVRKEPVYLGPTLNNVRVPGAFVTLREDTKDILGSVGSVYTPLQNKDAFRFFDAVVGEKAAMYHTAGALGKGEAIWMLAKLPGHIRVGGDDIAEKFLLLTNRHDGSASVQVMFTPIRVVCQNTLNVALATAGKRASMRHTMSIGIKVKDVQAELGIINSRFQIFEDASKKLATVQLTGEAWASYLKNVGLAPKNDDDATTRSNNIIDEVTKCFESGKGAEMVTAKGTAWGAFNAVVEYVDYFRSTRTTDNSALSARTESLLFGSGAVLKQKAWDTALELVK